MTLVDHLAFAPLVPAWSLVALGIVAAASLGVYLWRRGRAPVSRGAGLVLVLLGLAQPMMVSETREAVDDIALVLIDQSASLAQAGRLEAARAVGQAIAQQLQANGAMEVRVREVQGSADGTPLIGALEDALADAPRDRIAGAVLVTDGQVSDAPADAARLRALGPVHAAIIGDPARGDRRLELLSAPAFGLVGQPFAVEAVVHDGREGPVRVTARIDGQVVGETTVEANAPFTMQLSTSKRGQHLVLLEADAGPAEISAANNRAAFSLAGVRDRLRVLLVTGEPYPGARVWRNLLKADPAVDLVHFTILRPPDKDDQTPLEELALIQFPTFELFVEKLDRFDLIIFDRYRQRGGTPLLYTYFDNVARRVEAGGALLVVAGPYDAGPESVFATPLSAIMPAAPIEQLLERPFRPTPTALGARHPVLRGLPDPRRWGRWERLAGARASSGQTILDDGADHPVLVLGEAGRGRVAQLWSDQAWLWARGYDGGGPHAELLRRLAHWLMQEPELEAERVRLEARDDGSLVVERTTLEPTGPQPVMLTGPSGERVRPALEEAAPGLWRGRIETASPGVWQADSGGLSAFAAVGAVNAPETAALAATDALLAPVVRATGGGVALAGEQGEAAPEIRTVGRGERAQGDGWLGFRRRDAYAVRATRAEPLGPGWAWALGGLTLLMLGWRREAG